MNILVVGQADFSPGDKNSLGKWYLWMNAKWLLGELQHVLNSLDKQSVD